MKNLLVILLVMLIGILRPPTNVNADPSGVSFLDSAKVVAQLELDEESVTLQVKVFNGSENSQTLTLDIVNMVDADGVNLPDGVMDEFPMTVQNIAPAGVNSFEVIFRRIPDLSSAYSGELVAYSSDGSIARLPLEINIPSEPVPSFDQPGVNPEYLSELTLNAINLFPSPVSRFLFSLVIPPSFNVSQDYSTAMRTIGLVSGEDGSVAMVQQDGLNVSVHGLAYAGEYKGKVDLKPGEDKGDFSLIVKVRDVFIYALLVLIAGSAVVGWLDHIVKVVRKRDHLKLRLSKLRDKANSTQEQAKKDLSVAWKETLGQEVMSIYSKDDDQTNQPESLLGVEIKNIIDNFNDARSDTEREKWGAEGVEIAKLDLYFVSLRHLNELSQVMFNQEIDLKKRSIPDFEKLPVIMKAQSAYHPRLITVTQNMQKVTDDLNSSAAFLEKFSNLYKLALTLEVKFANSVDDLKQVVDIKKSLLLPTLESIDHLSAKEDQLKELDKKTVRTQDGNNIVANGPSDEVLKPSMDLTSMLDRQTRLLDGLPKDTETVRNQLKSVDRRFALVAGAIALLSGFVATYLADPTYGTTADYITTFIWSTTATALVQIGRHFLPLR
jgi:hypothetical protein